MYRCDIIGCPDHWPISTNVGSYVDGKLVGVISKAALVLKDGFTASGHMQEWLTYTITLKKIGGKAKNG